MLWRFKYIWYIPGSGQRYPWGVDLLPSVLETHAPAELIVLMPGTNDCKAVYGETAEIIGKGISNLIAC